MMREDRMGCIIRLYQHPVPAHPAPLGRWVRGDGVLRADCTKTGQTVKPVQLLDIDSGKGVSPLPCGF